MLCLVRARGLVSRVATPECMDRTRASERAHEHRSASGSELDQPAHWCRCDARASTRNTGVQLVTYQQLTPPNA